MITSIFLAAAISIGQQCNGPIHVSAADFIKQGVPKEVAVDEWYWRRKDNGFVCAEAHLVRSQGEMNGWTLVYLVGAKKYAIFQDFTDVTAWVNGQAYIVRPNQVQ